MKSFLLSFLVSMPAFAAPYYGTVFKCDYKAYNTANGDMIENNTVYVADNRQTKVKAGNLEFTALIGSQPSFDGDSYEYVDLQGKAKNSYVKTQSSTEGFAGSYTFGNRDVMGIMNCGSAMIGFPNEEIRPTFYFVAPDQSIFRAYDLAVNGKFPSEYLTQKGTCYVGEADKALKEMKKIWYSGFDKLQITNDVITFDVVKTRCLEKEENSDIPPGYNCLKSEEISRVSYSIPACN